MVAIDHEPGKLRRVTGSNYVKRGISHNGNTARSLSAEDGVLYRGLHQHMEPVLQRVSYLNEAINESSQLTNKNEWAYLGSIPFAAIQQFLDEKGWKWDKFARDNHGEKAALKLWVAQNHPHFLAPKRKASQILMPGIPKVDKPVKIAIPAGAKTA